MLELIFDKQTIEKNLYLVFLLGAAAVTVSIALSLVIFKELSSFPIVMLSAVAVVPTVMLLTQKEPIQHQGLIKHHKLVIVYSYIFFSMALAFAMWFAFLPEAITTNIFSAQLSKIPVTGLFSVLDPLFLKIFFNNIGLVLSFFLLSLFYGYGSILLVGWNASILGLMWGNALRVLIQGGGTTLLVRNSVIILPYLLPEVIAYFLAAIAGGIIYLNLSQHKKEDVTVDALKLLWLSVVLILAGAIIETFILRSLV